MQNRINQLIKKHLTQFLLWFWQRGVRAYSFSNEAIRAYPEKVKQIIFRFAHWCKVQLDKRINPLQKERLHRIVFETNNQRFNHGF